MYIRPFAGIYSLLCIVAPFFSCNTVDSPSIKPEFTKLRITEIHYHPRDADSLDDDEFEFIEIFNAHKSTVELGDVAFTSGIDYAFADNASLRSGSFFVLASNSECFSMRYGFDPDGVYSGKLKNSGEKIVLEDVSIGADIFSITYSDTNPWPIAADGYGFSLVPSSVDWSIDQSKAENWMRSSTIHGSPGKHDAAFNIDELK